MRQEDLTVMRRWPDGVGDALTYHRDIQEDLAEAMALRQRAAEYQLALYPGGGAQYVRHRDALPDDGSEDHQRRVRAALAQPLLHHAPALPALRSTCISRSSQPACLE